MKQHFNLSLTALFCATIIGFAACNDDEKDMTKPVITDTGIVANPINCQVYHPGEVIPFCYIFEDDTELGAYNIEVHSNFDHHSHSTEADDHDHDECEEGHEDHEFDHEATEGTQPWVYNQDFTIPAGQHIYLAKVNIPVPAQATPGLYHFMIRLTDKAGWQQLKAIAIQIEEQERTPAQP